MGAEGPIDGEPVDPGAGPAPGLEELPPPVREMIQRLQGEMHDLADRVAAATQDLTTETVRTADSTSEPLREARFDLLTAVNLTAESLHACARLDHEDARELVRAAERYRRRSRTRQT